MAATAILFALLGAGASGLVTPSGPQVPANLLRIEVHLDQPLPGLDACAIVLRDGAGQPINDALLDLTLSDADEHNFVILMQPGRIKHGVGPNLALGPALREGMTVSIEINDGRLAHPLARTWHVGAAVERPIVPASWTVRAPPAHTRAPLLLELSSPINASAAQLIAVSGADGRRIAGTAALDDGERRWRFTPAAPWPAGTYRVRIHPALEDPAGNRVCAAFEARLQSERMCADEAGIGFLVKAG